MDKALKTMIDNMPEKTGKPLKEWKQILKNKSFTKHTEAVNFLKKKHGITHGFANTIVHLSKDSTDSPEDLVANQYKGKEQLKPIYDKLIEKIDTFGDDITKTPKKTSVSIIRSKQFALIKPATKNRIDLGLKLKGKPTTDRLENSGPFGAMCTHRVRLTSVDEVDDQLVGWLREAYEKAE
jgi:predicted transport protein